MARPQICLAATVAVMVLGISMPSWAFDLIEVAIPKQATPNVTVAIAKAGQPQTVRTQAGDSVRSVVSARCGPVDPIYYSLLRDTNPGLPAAPDQPLAAGTTVVLPACAPQPAPEVREIKSGEMLSQLLPFNVLPRRAIDVSASSARRERLIADAFSKPQPATQPLPNGTLANARAAALALNEIVIAAPLKDADDFQTAAVRDPNSLAAGARVAVPAQRSVAKTIVLRADISPDSALKSINAAAVSDGIASGASLARPASEAKLAIPLSGGEAACTGGAGGDGWPLPLPQIEERLAANDRERPQGLKRERNLILVLDTGFDFRGVEPGFPDMAFPTVQSMRSKVSAIGLPAEASFTKAGVNLAARTTGGGTAGSYLVGGKEMRWHGAGVTSAALGSRALDGLRSPLHAGEIAIASTIMDDGDHPPFSSPSALGGSFSYADAIGARIVNYSFAIETDPNIDDTMVRYGRSVMLVAAAGNSGASAIGTWPARLGGDPGNARSGVVVTVGGHEPSGDIWPSSNRHAKRVDLLAPACGILAYGGELVGGSARPQPDTFAGTSFAAPLVSFVAGLLIAEGLPPADVKTRLLLSASVDGRTINASYSGGRLNAPVALSLYADVLRYRLKKDDIEQIAYGAFEDDAAAVSVCGQAMNLGKLHKLAFYDEGGEHKARYWWAETPDTLTRGDSDCLASEAALTLDFKTKDGSVLHVGPDQIVDYTRHYFQGGN